MGNTQTRARKRGRAHRGLVCEVGHDGEARVGFGREVMAQKKFVTYFPEHKEKREQVYAGALIIKSGRRKKKRE